MAQLQTAIGGTAVATAGGANSEMTAPTRMPTTYTGRDLYVNPRTGQINTSNLKGNERYKAEQAFEYALKRKDWDDQQKANFVMNHVKLEMEGRPARVPEWKEPSTRRRVDPNAAICACFHFRFAASLKNSMSRGLLPGQPPSM